jgi:NAD(P)-dependent dehydrogenase (short-subunit alcohol dehydrogenase family)
MKRRKWGRVIRLSGAGAPLPYPMFSAYSAAKIGVIGLAQTLAEEVQESGIQVNAVAPWLTNTKMQDEIISAGDLAGPSLQRVIDSKKGKRINPMSVADLITFLSSKAADGITGRFLSARWGDWQSLTDPSKMKGSLKVKRMR